MKRILSAIKRSKLNVRTFLLAILVAFCTSAVFGVIVNDYAAQNAQKSAGALIERLVDQCGRSVEAIVDEVQRISLNIIAEDVVQLLRGDASTARKFSIMHSVWDQITAYTRFRRDIAGIYLYGRDGSVFTSGSSRSLREGYSLLDQPWYIEGCQGTHFKIIYYENDAQFALTRGERYVSYIKNIFDYASREKLGALEIIVKLETFQDMFSIAPESGVAFDLYALDSLGRLIAKPDGFAPGKRAVMEAAVREIAQSPRADATWTLQAEGRSFLVSPYLSDADGITLFAVRQAQSAALVWSGFPVQLFFIGLGISVLLASILSLYVSNKIFGPLHKLQEVMCRISLNHVGERARVNDMDEIGQLALIFNEMMDDMDEQMQVNVRLEREKNRLSLERGMCELNALQSQINPHFLYNALEVISMTARMNGDLPAHKMAILLGKLLRASLVHLNHFVTLREEMEHVGLYMDFQHLVFKRLFNVAFDVDEALEGKKVTKLILQPIVENALKHAMKPGQPLTVTISAWCADGFVFLRVADNGKGMHPDSMAAYNQNLALGLASGAENIGLANTNKRIRIAYQSDDCGLRIEKSDEGGTTILITLPDGEGEETKT